MTKKFIFPFVLQMVLSLPLHAAETPLKAPAKPVLPAAQTTPEAVRKLTLKQLGARFPIALRGVDGRDGVSFNVRADEVVTQARLKLLFSYSPALLTEVSHINVLVNGEVAASLELPKQKPLSTTELVVDLPPRLITEYNKIDFQLIGHYTDKCEDPTHSSLWANISNLSTLEVSSEPVTLSSNLRVLPLPFMDPRDARMLKLPFVFVGPVDNQMLQAAGTVSSWFGALASYRGASFPASLNTLPAKGNAVVFLTDKQALPGLSSPASAGPTLTIVSNPNDPDGKLLLISGRDSQELRVAATALSTGTSALEGNSMQVQRPQNAVKRQPYDAPNWLASNRAVPFSELIDSAAMNVSGHNPGAIRLNMRLPPDLFRWNDSGIPVHLKYRYTPQAFKTENSSLVVNFNEQLVTSVPLLPVDRLSSLLPMLPMLTELLPDKTVSMSTRLKVPMYMVGHQSQLQLNFKYDYSKEGECRDIIVDNMRGAVEPDSSIDISAYPHYLAMPNLGVFSQSGFPFTRLADLSETAVVLPAAPTVQEYSAYLGLMGRMGQTTGYPATGVSVTQGGEVGDFANKDLLLIASGDNQPLLKTWRAHMQLQPGAKSSFKLFGFDLNPANWAITSAFAAQPGSDRDLFDGTSPRSVLLGFESPLAHGRSVVLMWGAQANDVSESLLAMLDAEGFASQIKGAVSVIRGNAVDSVEADSVYYVGSLPWLTQVRWRLSENFPLFLASSLASALLLAGMVFVALKRLAKRRQA